MPNQSTTARCDCPRSDHRHGTYSMYSKHNCRCFRCRLRASEMRRARRIHGAGLGEDLMVDRTGTARRLQALHRLGWTTPQIAERIGVSRQAVLYWRTYPGPILQHTATRVAAIYDELAMTSPPRTRGTVITINAAVRAGWPPPLAWDDDQIDDPTAYPFTLEDETLIDQAAVDTVLAGRRVPSLTWFERRALVQQGKAAGLTAGRITDLLRGIPIGKAPGTLQQAKALADVLDRTRVAA